MILIIMESGVCHTFLLITSQSVMAQNCWLQSHKTGSRTEVISERQHIQAVFGLYKDIVSGCTDHRS